MTKTLAQAAAAIAAVAVLAPATAAQAAGKTEAQCSPWSGTQGLKVRVCMSMTSAGSTQDVTGRLEVKNTTKNGQTVTGKVFVSRNGDGSSDTGSAYIPAGAARTVATKTAHYRQKHGSLSTIGSMTSPVSWGSYTLTMSY